MSKEEVIEKLKKLKSSNPDISFSTIERAVKIPKNNLVGMINGSRNMPQKWVDALSAYLTQREKPEYEEGAYYFYLAGQFHKKIKIEEENFIWHGEPSVNQFTAPKTDDPLKDKEKRAEEAEDLETAQKAARIAQLVKEIRYPPEKFTSDLAKKVYIFDRKKELEQLKKQII